VKIGQQERDLRLGFARHDALFSGWCDPGQPPGPRFGSYVTTR
jgi:hypothetical protein